MADDEWIVEVHRGRIEDHPSLSHERATRGVCAARCGAALVTWRGREARNEVRSRDRNEWIEATSERFGSDLVTVYVCECGDDNCTTELTLTRAEYEAVRSVANRFAIGRNHENPESEVVISESARYAVVDKIEGVAMRIARDTDPRSNTHVPRDPRIESGE